MIISLSLRVVPINSSLGQLNHHVIVSVSTNLIGQRDPGRRVLERFFRSSSTINLGKPELCQAYACCVQIFRGILPSSRRWLVQRGFIRPRRALSLLRRKASSSMFLAAVSFLFPANALAWISDDFLGFCLLGDDACLVFAVDYSV